MGIKAIAFAFLGLAAAVSAAHGLSTGAKVSGERVPTLLSAADINLAPVLSGLNSPLYLTNAHDGSGRLFILEQPGRIKLLQRGASVPSVFLDITSRVLSGGERGRYALLRLLLHPANFLLLDEPTNHLDMRAKDVLLEALMKYTGTVVFVSHDRYFIDNLATRVFEVGDGKVEIFPGNYEDYMWRKQGGQHVAPTLDDVPEMSAKRPESSKSVGAPLLAEVARSGSSLAPTSSNGGNKATTSAEPKKRLNPIKRKQMEDRIQVLEEEISGAEDEIARLETALQIFVSAEDTQRQSQELDQRKASHADLIAEWEGLSEELEVSE